MMDPVQTLSATFALPLITGGAGVVIVLIIIVIVYKFSIQEKSFEEVIEEQKRRKLEEEQQQKLKKSKKEKVFKRSWANKKKEKVERDITPDLTSVEEKREIPQIEIIEPKESKPGKLKSKKTNSPSQNASFNMVEKSEKEIGVGHDKPMQDKRKDSPVMEKKKDGAAVEKKKESQIEKKKETVVEQKKEPLVVEQKKETLFAQKEVEKSTAVEKQVEILKSKENVAFQSSAVPASSATKRKRKEQPEKATIVETLTATKLLSLIKEAALDTDEIQNLIDILLNKQKDSANWTKKNDQLANTKRDLLEKEQRLDLELRQNQAVVLKLKDLREEYNQFKAKTSVSEKASQEKIAKQQQDIQTFTARVKQLNEQFTAEKEKCVQLEKQIDEKVAEALKKLEDENAKLQKKVIKLEADSSQSGSSKADLEAMKKSREDLQKVHNLLVEQHTQLVGSHQKELKNVNAKFAAVEKQFEEVNAKDISLTKDIQTLKDTKAALELSKNTLEEKLKIEEKRSAELELQVKQLSSKVTNANQLQLDVKALQLENERLREQLISTKERVAGDGQEVVHQNGEINGKVQDDPSLKSLEEKEKLLKEREMSLAQVNEECNKLKEKVFNLDQEVEDQKKKNNELREKNWKAMDALKNAEQSAELKIKEVQSLYEKRLSESKKEHEEKLSSSDKSESSIPAELTERLKVVESDYYSELDKTKQLTSEVNRLNSLHNSTTSRLSETEKTVQDLSSHIRNCEARTKESLLRIHPSVTIDSSLPYDTWLLEFQKQASLALQAAGSSRKDEEELSSLRLMLEEKDKELLEKESKIKGVMMTTLQNLQESAEANEAKWREELQSKEAELQKVLSERDALVVEKETIQSTFQQVEQLKELQEKLKLLQNTIETSESLSTHLQQQYDEVQKNCLNLRDQLENKEKQLAELEKEKNSVEHLRQEIEDLKTKLDKEKKINKDFSSQMIRLNSLVKIGQDSLTAEQDMVKKLKSQLAATQVSATNGSPPAPVQSLVTNSESKPKAKSSEKSKKKMDASAKK